MYERSKIYVLLYAASILGLQGQSIDSVVQDAVTSAFNRGRGTTQITGRRSLIPTSEQKNLQFINDVIIRNYQNTLLVFSLQIAALHPIQLFRKGIDYLDITILLLGIAGGTADPPSGSSRGSSAVNSLNRFSQNNEPEMNQLLDDRARFAADATKNIAAR